MRVKPRWFGSIMAAFLFVGGWHCVALAETPRGEVAEGAGGPVRAAGSSGSRDGRGPRAPAASATVESLAWVGASLPSAKLVLSDDFDGPALDRSKWCTRYQHAGGPPLQVADDDCVKFGNFGTLDFLNEEQQRYVDRNREGRVLHRIDKGVLHLTASRTLPGPYVMFESSMIRSKREFKPAAKRSYVMTARVRLPNVKGTWPAIWVSPGIDGQQKTAWPPEVDLLEGALNASTDLHDMVKLGAQAQNWGGKGVSDAPTTLTYAHPSYDRQTRRFKNAASMRGVWIEFGAHWTAESICYYIDRIKIACEAYRWVDNDERPAPAGPLMLNLGIGGQWAGADGIDLRAFPTSFDVDYVRVYEAIEP